MNKVFLSYSHKDESYKDELVAHLSQMKRKGEISSWDDRVILPGEEWEEKIDENLKAADVILFLVSADFINSDYCYDVEMMAAMSQHEAGESVVIPVFVRSCDFEGAPFGRVQGVPKDAKPISSWSDRDAGWLDVIKGVKKAIDKLGSSGKLSSSSDQGSDFLFSDTFASWVEDTEIKLSHRRALGVNLSDVFVAPDVKELISDSDEVSEYEADVRLSEPGCYLVFGEEQSGKTSLIKQLCRDFFDNKKLPIFLDAKSIKTSEIFSLIDKASKFQYGVDACVLLEDERRKVLLVDDFSEIGVNDKHTDRFLRQCAENFDHIILFAVDSYQYVAPDIEELEGFCYLEIMPFGNLKRYRLIEKWVSLGKEQQIEESELYQSLDEIKLKLDSLVRKSVIPPKPIYLLSLLQLFEAYTPQKLDLTSYGHCYQYLVYQALEKSNIKHTEIDKYLNVMTEFSWAQFLNNGDPLLDNDVEVFFDNYEKVFLKVDRKRIVNNLISNGLLSKHDGGVRFKYPYIYYFFAAKKISDCLKTDEKVREKFSYLLENLHKEDCANIIIFITHYAKDPWVLDEIQISLMELFDEYKPATLENKSLEFMEDFLDNIPSLVIEKRKIEDERLSYIKEQDEIEKKKEEFDKEVDRLSPHEILAQINKAFKGMEIVGQIVRNRHASLDREAIYSLVNEGLNTGLRFLEFFLSMSDASKGEVVKIIEHVLKENPRISNEDIEKEAKHAFLTLTYGVIFGVLRKMANSMGGVEIEEIFEEVEEYNYTPSVMLVNESIQLQFHKRLDFDRIDRLQREFKSNPVCLRILRENIVQHIYMFPVGFKDKQRVSQSLGISMKRQRYLDSKKGVKM